MKIEKTITCMLMPIENKFILLPCATIAEIIAYDINIIDNSQPQKNQLGTISWRTQHVPVVNVSQLFFQAKAPSNIKYLAIINGVGEKLLDYFALPLTHMPKLIALSQGDIMLIEAANHSLISATIEVEGESVCVPNLTALELKLLDQTTT